MDDGGENDDKSKTGYQNNCVEHVYECMNISKTNISLH